MFNDMWALGKLLAEIAPQAEEDFFAEELKVFAAELMRGYVAIAASACDYVVEIL